MAEKIKVVICTGTACFVMGATDILLLEETLPEDLRGRVEIEGTPCLGYCKNHGSKKAPCVTVNGELMPAATLPAVVRRVKEIADAEYK